MKRMMKVFGVGTAIACMTVVAAISTKTTASAATVTGIEQTDSSTTTATLDWQDVTGARGYNVYLSKDGGYNYERISSGSYDAYSSEEKLYGLESGASYYVKIAAVDSNENEIAMSDSFEIVTAPESVSNLKYVGANDTTATIEWSAAKGADAYIVESEGKAYPTLETKYKVPVVGTTSAKVYSCRVSESEYVALGDYTSIYDDLRNLTTKISTKKFAITYAYTSINCFDIGVIAYGNGVQLEAYNCVTGKKLCTETATIYSSSDSATLTVRKFKNNIPCMYRVRAYIVTSDGKKVYGKWSDYQYMVNPDNLKYISTKSKLTLKFPKLKNVVSIKVLMSNKSEKGFKKIGTVKGNKRSLVVTKYNKKSLKKGTKYYLKLIYTIKDKKGKKHTVNMGNIYYVSTNSF